MGVERTVAGAYSVVGADAEGTPLVNKHYDRILKLEVQNDATLATAQKFEAHLKTLLSTPDLDALQVSILESRSQTEMASGLGLLMLVKDYPVKLGVMFMRNSPEREIITVRVYYRIETS